MTKSPCILVEWMGEKKKSVLLRNAIVDKNLRELEDEELKTKKVKAKFNSSIYEAVVEECGKQKDLEAKLPPKVPNKKKTDASTSNERASNNILNVLEKVNEIDKVNEMEKVNETEKGEDEAYYKALYESLLEKNEADKKWKKKYKAQRDEAREELEKVSSELTDAKIMLEQGQQRPKAAKMVELLEGTGVQIAKWQLNRAKDGVKAWGP